MRTRKTDKKFGPFIVAEIKMRQQKHEQNIWCIYRVRQQKPDAQNFNSKET